MKHLAHRYRTRVAWKRKQDSTGKIMIGKSILGVPIIFTVMLTAGCGTPPVSLQEPVSFSGDVYPILRQHCHQCHLPPGGEGYRKTGLNMNTYADLIRGTRYGPVVVPGDSRHSILAMLVEGRAGPSMRMPHNQASLESRQIEIIDRWIDQGAKNN